MTPGSSFASFLAVPGRSQGVPSLPLRLRRDAQVEEHGADGPAGPPPTGSEPEFATQGVAPPANLVEFGLVGNKTLGLLDVSMIGRSARR